MTEAVHTLTAAVIALEEFRMTPSTPFILPPVAFSAFRIRSSISGRSKFS